MRIKMIFLCNEALSRIFFDGGGKGDGEIAFVEDDSNFFFSSEMETSSAPQQSIGGLEAPFNQIGTKDTYRRKGGCKVLPRLLVEVEMMARRVMFKRAKRR